MPGAHGENGLLARDDVFKPIKERALFSLQIPSVVDPGCGRPRLLLSAKLLMHGNRI